MARVSGDKAEDEAARALRRLIEGCGLTMREKGAADLARALALDASAAPYAYTDGATATALSIKALRDMRDAFAPLPPTPREMLRFVEVFGTPPIIGIDLARQEASWSSEYMGTFAPAGSRREMIYSGATKRADLEAMERAAMPKVARPAPPPPANRARYAARLANVEAHGPAWSLGTPHTDEEAREMLMQVETRAMVRERARDRSARAQGEVYVEPSPVVTVGEPIPRATLTLAEWREAWRAAEVPPLCALVPRCEATGARLVLPLDGLEPPEAVRARYGSGADGPLSGALWALDGTSAGVTVERVCRVGEESYGAEHVPADAERVTDLAVLWRGAWRAAPSLSDARGWCPTLAGYAASSAPVDPETAAATWQAMCAACPERVYPEPGE